jgi:hypothetical protein
VVLRTTRGAGGYIRQEPSCASAIWARGVIDLASSSTSWALLPLLLDRALNGFIAESGRCSRIGSKNVEGISHKRLPLKEFNHDRMHQVPCTSYDAEPKTQHGWERVKPFLCGSRQGGDACISGSLTEWDLPRAGGTR